MMEGMVFAGRYRLESFIGQGGMSLVYRDVDTRTGHNVAVKILKSEYNTDKEFLERFQREAQAASRMSHHNLVNLLDVGMEDEYRYLVLEYVNGSTLKDLIRQKGKLSCPTAIKITIRILSALQHAHDNGIIHRDIKPQNVLIHSDGRVKVSDFGIARMAGGATIGKGDTVVGSVHYSSPEQVSAGAVDITSDLYSTGIVLYEMLTGRVPFLGDTPVAVAMQQIQDAPPPIRQFAPATPQAVVDVVMKALEKDPKNRYQSATEMADALLKAEKAKPDKASRVSQKAPAESPVPPREPVSPVQPAPTGKRGSRRRRMIANVLAMLAALLIVIGLIWGVFAIYDIVSRSASAPDVVGSSLQDAQSAIRQAGLNCQENYVNSAQIPADTIISQFPEAGTGMQKGDYIILNVSIGGSTIPIPDMTGMGYEAAAARLKERGFGNVVIVKTVSSQQPGTVLEQSPAAGTSAAAGSDVELTISGGSTTIPEITGQSTEDARAQLEEAQLSAGTVSYIETADPALVGQVLAQNPAAGTMAILNAPVAMTIGVELQPYQGELSLTLAPSPEDRQLRIALVPDGEEHTAYEGTIVRNMDSAMLIPLTSSTGGEIECRIYLDGILYDTVTVNLKE